MLSLAKILENMEIGHNVMHGQWDWMNDPQINSTTWDWDSASTAEAWKHSHNYIHHTYTNIRGKDRDLGYEIMRIDPHQRWNPVYLAQPFYNLVLAAFFEWGVASHDLDFEAIKKGEKSKEQIRRELKGMARKGRQQITKDYIVWPVISGLVSTGVELARAGVRARQEQKSAPRRALEGAWSKATGTSRKESVLRQLIERRSFRRPFRTTLTADFTANVVRNVWAYAIIFCGHFPDQTYTFSQEETADESRGGLLRPPAARRREHRGQPAVPRDQRQPRLPGRAPPLPRHAQHPLRRDRAAREGAVRALRAPVQHRPVPHAARHGPAHDPQAGVPGRQAAPEARAVPRRRERVDGGERLAPPRSDGARWIRPRAADGRRAGVHAPGGLSAQAPPGGQADPADRTAKLNLATGPGAPLGASARTARVCLPGRTR